MPLALCIRLTSDSHRAQNRSAWSSRVPSSACRSLGDSGMLPAHSAHSHYGVMCQRLRTLLVRIELLDRQHYTLVSWLPSGFDLCPPDPNAASFEQAVGPDTLVSDLCKAVLVRLKAKLPTLGDQCSFGLCQVQTLPALSLSVVIARRADSRWLPPVDALSMSNHCCIRSVLSMCWPVSDASALSSSSGFQRSPPSPRLASGSAGSRSVCAAVRRASLCSVICVCCGFQPTPQPESRWASILQVLV